MYCCDRVRAWLRLCPRPWPWLWLWACAAGAVGSAYVDAMCLDAFGGLVRVSRLEFRKGVHCPAPCLATTKRLPCSRRRQQKQCSNGAMEQWSRGASGVSACLPLPAFLFRA